MKIKNHTVQSALQLRHLVLWPNQDPQFCQVANDDSATHYGVFIEDNLVSVASVYIQGDSARLRKFATLQVHQEKGIGSKLLSHIIERLKEQGISSFWCDARKSAIGFYNSFGMKTEGDEFSKSGMPYVKMTMT